jgi:hypothetical protein
VSPCRRGALLSPMISSAFNRTGWTVRRAPERRTHRKGRITGHRLSTRRHTTSHPHAGRGYATITATPTRVRYPKTGLSAGELSSSSSSRRPRQVRSQRSGDTFLLRRSDDHQHTTPHHTYTVITSSLLQRRVRPPAIRGSHTRDAPPRPACSLSRPSLSPVT